MFVSQCVTLHLFCLSFNTGHNTIIYSQTKLLPTVRNNWVIFVFFLFFNRSPYIHFKRATTMLIDQCFHLSYSSVEKSFWISESESDISYSKGKIWIFEGKRNKGKLRLYFICRSSRTVQCALVNQSLIFHFVGQRFWSNGHNTGILFKNFSQIICQMLWK